MAGLAPAIHAVFSCMARSPPDLGTAMTNRERCKPASVTLTKRPVWTAPLAASLDSNNRRTYHELSTIKEVKMHPIAAYALRDIAEIAALGAFLIMIALIARAVGS
jgi:hypothetical protein